MENFTNVTASYGSKYYFLHAHSKQTKVIANLWHFGNVFRFTCP